MTIQEPIDTDSDWKINSKRFAEMLVNGLTPNYAKDVPDLVQRISELIDTYFEERTKFELTDPDEICKRNYGGDRTTVLKVLEDTFAQIKKAVSV